MKYLTLAVAGLLVLSLTAVMLAAPAGESRGYINERDLCLSLPWALMLMGGGLFRGAFKRRESVTCVSSTVG